MGILFWLRRASARVFAPASLVLIAACSAASGSGEGDVAQSQSAILTPDIPANQTAFDYFVGKGLTNFQAAGIVGNLDQESQMDPGAVQAGGPGRGIAQWSVGGRWDTGSGDNLLAYAAGQGASATSLTLQLDFIWYELQTFSGYGLAALRASTNVTDATIAFETDFEGCGTCDQATRIAYAQAALNAYGTIAVEYAAAFVSQSFPLASTAITMVAGQTLPAFIELKNTGAKAWDTSTHLGTSSPRDRASAFADSTWMAPNRPAGVSGTVAPGASYKFAFDLHAPAKAGTYLEYFNVVQEGVAWFSDPGQGGPADNDLEANIVVVDAPAPPAADGGPTTGTDKDGGAGGATDDGGGGGVSTGGDSGAAGGGASGSGGAGASGQVDDGGTPANGASASGSGAVGASCAAAPASRTTGSAWWIVAAGAVGVARRRSRRRV